MCDCPPQPASTAAASGMLLFPAGPLRRASLHVGLPAPPTGVDAYFAGGQSPGLSTGA